MVSARIAVAGGFLLALIAFVFGAMFASNKSSPYVDSIHDPIPTIISEGNWQCRAYGDGYWVVEQIVSKNAGENRHILLKVVKHR